VWWRRARMLTSRLSFRLLGWVGYIQFLVMLLRYELTSCGRMRLLLCVSWPAADASSIVVPYN
jgi:hypothetical protein